MGKKIGTPVFVISFDVELGWGFLLNREDAILRMLQKDHRKACGTLKRLLNVLKTYEIPATWAVVGHLLQDMEEAIQDHICDLPQFKEGWIDRETYMNICSHPLYHFKESIIQISGTAPEHEIGLHSFFHLPFPRCSREVAEAEIEQGTKALHEWGISPQILCFSGNYIHHIDLLKKYGYQIYRGRDATRYNSGRGFAMRKITGAIDKVLAPTVSPNWNNGIWEIPSSIYFCDPQAPFTLVPRAIGGLNMAIQTGRVFHIWLHPWNILLYDSLEKDLANFLKKVAGERDKGVLSVMTMGELADNLNKVYPVSNTVCQGAIV